MKPFLNPKDDLLAGNPLSLVRMVGKKRKANWKLAAVARVAPEMLDGEKVLESQIHNLIEGEVQAAGLPYLSLREHLYGWLKEMAGRNHWQAAELLDCLKDLPDLVVFDRSSVGPGSRCLLLELKRRTGRGSTGQRRLAEAAGGTIAKGYSAAHLALTQFLQNKTNPLKDSK